MSVRLVDENLMVYVNLITTSNGDTLVVNIFSCDNILILY